MSSGQDNVERIEIVSSAPPYFGRWNPVVTTETRNLLDHFQLDLAGRATIRDEAVSILARCVSPTATNDQETGLVMGYVQSGKTMSFTTVAALARDNGYPFIIVIAGTSIPLTGQSCVRLRSDLRLDQRDDHAWRHIHNPKIANQDHIRIENVLAEWRDPNVPPTERCTLLVTVMKHHNHLNHLIDVLRQVNLSQTPVLIVDDEADQAGLNNLVRQGEESTTYQRLRVLKSVVPHHTFLQYTATPQGPLLINLIDVLSPGFAVTLTPGADYTGGPEFFLNAAPLVRQIPPDQIPRRNQPLHDPPESLLEALRLFFLGVASGLVRENGVGNRSMMVHPSQATVGHQQYFNWVSAARNSWLQILSDPADTDYADLLDDFRRPYADLQSTVPDLEPLDTLAQRLTHAIRRTDIHLINASRGGRTPQIDWRGAYSHILVGGKALDRGFTVEGLAVTYMPRGVGTRRADTIQQRARFFGYKRPFLGYCRVFLEPDVADAFHRYVEHEEDIRRQLSAHAATGRPLDELRRVFLLSRTLAPTRDSIIDIDYVRARLSEGWFYPRAPHDTEQSAAANRIAISQYLQTITLSPDDGHPDRTDMQHHQVAFNVPLASAYEQLLMALRFRRLDDAQDFLGVLVILSRYIDQNPDATCTIYEMSGGQSRRRTLNANGKIPYLFQGAAPVNPPSRRGSVYPGDSAIHSANGVTIQLHTLDLLASRTDPVTYQAIPNIAIWMPQSMAGDILIQDQGNLVAGDDA